MLYLLVVLAEALAHRVAILHQSVETYSICKGHFSTVVISAQVALLHLGLYFVFQRNPNLHLLDAIHKFTITQIYRAV